MMRGFISLLLGTFLVRGISFLATVVLTRVVGPSDFGTFALGLTVAQLFGVCANFGLDDLLVREISRAPGQAASLIGDQLLLRLATLPLAGLGAIVLAVTINPQHAALYAWFALYAVLHACLLVMCGAFRGLGRPREHALLLSLQMLFVAPASIAASWLAQSIDLAAAGFAVGTVAALGVGYARLRGAALRPHFAWRPRTLSSLLRTSLSFGLVLLGLLLHDRLVFVWVALTQDPRTTGWFGAAYNLVLAVSSIAMAASAAAYPVLALDHHQRQRAAFIRLTTTLVGATLVLGVAAAAVLHVAAPILVPLLFGSTYAASIPILEVVAWALPTFSVSLVLINVLEAADRQRACAIAIGQALIVSAPVCWIGIGLWGVQGAAIGYVIGHAVLASSLAWRTWPALERASVSQLVGRTADA